MFDFFDGLTNAPNVAAVGVFATQDLRCYVVGCADFGFHDSLEHVVVPRETKINNFNGRIFCWSQEEKVFGFQVAMDDLEQADCGLDKSCCKQSSGISRTQVSYPGEGEKTA